MIDYAEGSGKQYHTGVGPEDIGWGKGKCYIDGYWWSIGIHCH